MAKKLSFLQLMKNFIAKEIEENRFVFTNLEDLKKYLLENFCYPFLKDNNMYFHSELNHDTPLKLDFQFSYHSENKFDYDKFDILPMNLFSFVLISGLEDYNLLRELYESHDIKPVFTQIVLQEYMYLGDSLTGWKVVPLTKLESITIQFPIKNDSYIDVPYKKLLAISMQEDFNLDNFISRCANSNSDSNVRIEKDSNEYIKISKYL